MRSWGEFVYVFEDGRRMAMKRAMGWCNACKDITVVEELPEKMQLYFCESGNTDEGHIGLGKRIWRYLQFWKDAKPIIINPIPHLSDSQQVKLFREWKKKRIQPARCLSCGATDFLQIPLTNNNNLEVDFLKHPYCGGLLIGKSADFHISIELSTHIFDINANPLPVSGANAAD
jgi:hypothetical protein